MTTAQQNIALPGLDNKEFQPLNRAVQALAQGRSNATGSVTLGSSASSTTVTNSNCSVNSSPYLTPTTSNARAETWYIGTVANGSFTIAHSTGASVDRTFLYGFLG